MNTILKLFTAGSLFDACAAMLRHLHIEFNEVTRTPVTFESLYLNQMPKSLCGVLSKVDKTYFIGTIDEASLSGNSSRQDQNDVTTQAKEGRYVGMMVFAVDIHPNQNITRTELATLTRGFNRIASAQPVVLFIRQGACLSLSTCERSEYTQQWRDGEKLGKVSLLRDIDCNHPHRGHIDILESIGDKVYPSFEDLYKHWMDVFSSELLTKRFYTELSEWYAWATKVIRFPNALDDDKDDDKYNTESGIRLVTRLIFVWFLKQKGLVPEEFFDEKSLRQILKDFDPTQKEHSLFGYMSKESKYYKAILQNLFFAMLNTPLTEGNDFSRGFRKYDADGKASGANRGDHHLMRYKNLFVDSDEFLRLANKVPFLNGGLFECLDDVEGKFYLDGFSENEKVSKSLCVPDYLFFGEREDIDLSEWYDNRQKRRMKIRGLIEILKSYQFTIEENTPYEQEVSLDPELLGKVFENLLASYNPETKKTARKSTGSYYTPREIVQYMVDESLVAYLKEKVGEGLEEQYRQLLDYSEIDTELTPDQKHKIMLALYQCKVLDPACGSGAFPMGILQQMVHVLAKLDPDNVIWKRLIEEKSKQELADSLNNYSQEERDEVQADINRSFDLSQNAPSYARKLYLIENCIYGVDIQTTAIQISKLRCFISLVVDQMVNDNPVDNYGIRPLPNLEARFVAANTLIGIDSDLSLANTDEVMEIKSKLKDANHRIFSAKTIRTKRKWKDNIKTNREELCEALEKTGFISHDEASLVSSWDMFNQNTSSSFFDQDWMFGVTDGFDIVIGNPPYIQLQADKGKLANLYEPCGFNTFDRGGDIYCLFYERGCQLLKQGGHLCYITSNKWMRAGYGKKTRDFLSKKTSPELLIDFAGVKIFESASVDTNILLYAKKPNQHKTICAYADKQNKDIIKNDISKFVQNQNLICSYDSSDIWVVLTQKEQEIKRKIESIGKPLKDWGIKINYGIKTGCNDAFIISTEKRNEILSNCQTDEERERTAELIRPLIKGEDIKRYSYNWEGLWLINTHNGVRGKILRIDINDYPAVKRHLDEYWDRISNRSDKGATPYNLRNCAYLEDFSCPKIVYPETTQGAYFAYDDSGIYIDKTCFMMVGDNCEYIQKTLSSKLFEVAYKRVFSSVELGENGYQYNKHALEKLPIAPITDKTVETDEDFYHLYGLTYDEVLVIDPDTPIKREEY